jgi:predicted transposase YdaD
MGQTDLTIRLLAEHHLTDLLPALLADRQVEVITVERTELKVVERLTDQVVRARVDGVESILHIEFPAVHEPDLPERMLAYHALLRHRHWPLPVVSIVVYLMHAPPPEPVPRGLRQGQLAFEYQVFLPWERPIGPEQLERFPAVAPLAALTPGIHEGNLRELRRVVLAAPGLSRAQRADLLALTFFLARRRFAEELLEFLLARDIMEESVTYRNLVERKLAEGRVEGRVDGMRDAIVKLIRARMERTPEDLETRLAALDVEALDRLIVDLAHAADEAAFQAVLERQEG